MNIIILYFTILGVNNWSCLCLIFNQDVSEIILTIYNRNYPHGTPLVTGTIILHGSDIFVLAHGWRVDSNVQWIVNSVPNILLQYPEANVVVIDYSPYSNDPLYVQNVCTVPFVGEAAADKLIFLNADPNLISCTGHSMGAQVCGAFGRRFIDQNLGQIARITGLDAAGPGFDNRNYLEMIPIVKQISKSDAKRVVGIYTDSGGWGFGMNRNPGYSHISIIINEGENQNSCKSVPACTLVTILSLGKTDLSGCFFCSHQFSREVYERAMAGKLYRVTQCDSYMNYKIGKCNENPTFIYADKIDRLIHDGIYRISINGNYDQIAYNA